jgi:hypothetical protein
VDSGCEHALETAIAIHQAALGVTDHDPLVQNNIGFSPCDGWLVLVVRPVSRGGPRAAWKGWETAPGRVPGGRPVVAAGFVDPAFGAKAGAPAAIVDVSRREDAAPA